MKPLVDYSSIGQEKVMCMDIHEESGLMLSGYKDGGLALWDLLEYKLLKYIPEHHAKEITNVKFVHLKENGSILAVTCEEGASRWIEISKRAIFGGYSF
jgi:WD40 repeat protein